MNNPNQTQPTISAIVNTQIKTTIGIPVGELPRQLDLYNENKNPDILECLSNLSSDEVFTPPKIANQMLDVLPPSLWQNPNATFLDPVSKTGVFLREIVKRLNRGLAEQIPDTQTRINHILTRQVFGIAITELTALLSRRTVYCAKDATHPKLSLCSAFTDPMGNIVFGATAHKFANGKCRECGASEKQFGARIGLENHAYAFIHTNYDSVFNRVLEMKFDVVIGNPPYQLDTAGKGNGAQATPIYQKFVQQAKKLDPKYLVMITPSRWFTGGMGLNSFRDEMLVDKRISQIHDFPNSKDCFDGVEIKGGVNYFLWDSSHDGDCAVFSYEDGVCVSRKVRPLKEQGVDVFIRQNNAIDILRKVQQFNEVSFSKIVSTQNPFGLGTSFRGNSDPYKNSSENVFLYQTKSVGYVELSKITKNRDWVLRHKLLTPKAIGAGNGNDLVKPIYAGINTACTETYVVIGPFASEQICQNVMSYINTKFFHFMLTLKKNTQDALRGVYQFVPIQDFNETWTDAKLYKKYGLTNDEILYIETMIRPMDVPVQPQKDKKAAQADLL